MATDTQARYGSIKRLEMGEYERVASTIANTESHNPTASISAQSGRCIRKYKTLQMKLNKPFTMKRMTNIRMVS
jgi:hypothetical protein